MKYMIIDDINCEILYFDDMKYVYDYVNKNHHIMTLYELKNGEYVEIGYISQR